MSLWVTCLIFCLASFPQKSQSKPLTNLAAEAKVRQVLKALPPKPYFTFMRSVLKSGRGDGIRQPCMNDMQRQGVKLALARVEFVWDQAPRSSNVVWIRYLADYSVDYGDLRSEANRLRQVKVSPELDRKLREVAEAKAMEHVPEVMSYAKELQRARGTVTVLLFDDEWLPSRAYYPPEVDKVTDPDQTELMRVVSRCGVYWNGGFYHFALDEPNTRKRKIEEAQGRAEAAVRRLIAAGTDVNAKDQNGLTALAYAAGGCRASVVQLLLQAGAQVNVRDRDGETPLMCAVGDNKMDIVEVLLAAGAEVDARDNSGSTALANDVESDDDAMIQRLLAAGADVNARDKDGWTPLMIAAFKGVSVVQTLLTGGADVNAADNKGRTPLILAADSGKVEAVQALLAAHANVNAKTKNGQTALSTAMRRASMNSALNERFLEIADLLRQAGARE